ncbi:FMN-binding negative transcriptional regulator [Paucibacter sp. M5-1]|uniref:FMN-binding negative transcriptional regulator n=1 Tax=Paucibacter sp. M5-1 TaxID=3015998 RepID=UPI0022B925A8|nr:FMN-binding negative transcriptional regulator [Paucibacter sp. M5-1]MCZ7881001.1 FMN-binding negative transcriptional regulator [Paucibacter sp. M5-1]
MSMYESLPFQPAADSEIERLVAAHPLATLVSSDAGRMLATPLPLILQRDADGSRVFIGHLARRNPQHEMLKRNPKALATFTGAQGYIASSWLRSRRYAPTWNYEFVQFELDVALIDTPEETLFALDTLIAHVEAPYPNPWRSAEMGPRREQLAQYIVPFRARVIEARAQFKLGQGDPAEALEDTHAALARYGQFELSEAMRRHERLLAAQG